MPPSNLSKCIVTPNKLVSILDWKRKGVVMALHITDNGVGVAYAPAPSKSSYAKRRDAGSLNSLSPIQYMSVDTKPAHPILKGSVVESRTRLPRSLANEMVADQMEEILCELDVKSFVVSWPVKSNGKMGKDCGRALHLLDCFADRDEPLISKSCPFTLWDTSSGLHDRLDTITSSNKKHPLREWLISEELLRKDLKGTRGAEDSASSVDESEKARSTLQNFIEENWGIRMESSDVRDQVTMESFFKYDAPEDAQSAKMSLLM